MVSDNKKIWPHDLLHFGHVCEHIRTSRGISQEEIAKYCNLNRSAISRLEDGRASLSTLNGYISALQSELVPRRGLTDDQADVLRELYTCSKEVPKRELKLTAIDFDDILPGRRPRALNDLVSKLEQEDRPAMIMDSLWFVHAFNGALLHLFGLHQATEIFHHWTGWHVLGVKFYADSPVRLAHFNPDEYFPPTITQFYLDNRTYPYLFTAQMRCLIKRLDELSEKYKLKFTKWWLQAISFDLDYDLDKLTRTLIYQKERIQTEAYQRMKVEVEVTPGQWVYYMLGIWDPIGSDARKVFEKISHLADSHEIIYAADYDKNHDFHVNNWQELKYIISFPSNLSAG
jgi:transcriptional regulator with XRE-family HTH domain